MTVIQIAISNIITDYINQPLKLEIITPSSLYQLSTHGPEYMAPEKVFLEVARKLLEFTLAEGSEASSHLAIAAARRELVWGRQPPVGNRGSAPDCLFLSMD